MILLRRLYPRIHATQPELAGKITGMLLEMEISELIYLLDTEEALTSKVQEALQVSSEHPVFQRIERSLTPLAPCRCWRTSTARMSRPRINR